MTTTKAQSEANETKNISLQMSKIEDPVRLSIEWHKEQESGCKPERMRKMSLYINIEQTADVAVLQCAGRMVRSQALSLLKDAVTSLSRLRVVVLDLSEVEMLDAGGLGMLVSLHNWACVNGIQLKLVNPSKPARQILELTRLTSVFHISSVEDVIQIFCSGDQANKSVVGAVA